MDHFDVESKEGTPESPRSTKRDPLAHLFDPLKVPTVIDVVGIGIRAPQRTAPAEALALDMELGKSQSPGSSVVSSFDMSSLTHTDFRGEDAGSFGLNHRLGSATTNTKLLAMERAHLLDLSLTMEREDDSGTQFPIYSFTMFTSAASLLIFLPLLWVPREVQRATFVDSPLLNAMASVEFYNAVYFLIGSCSCLAFESVMSIILFYFYQKSIEESNSFSPSRRSVLLGPRVILTMCLVSFSTICIVMVPYLFVLGYREEKILVDEVGNFICMTTWQYEMAETVAICYTLSNLKLSNHFGVCGVSDKVLIESTLIASWTLNLVSRVMSTDSNLGGSSMLPAVLPSVGALLGYFLALVVYIYFFLRDGLDKKSGKEKYRATANFLILGVTVIYMANKFMLRSALSYHLADTTISVLVSRTFILNILIVPMSFLLPARVMQVDHFFVRNALTTLTTNLQKLQEKDKEALNGED